MSVFSMAAVRCVPGRSSSLARTVSSTTTRLRRFSSTTQTTSAPRRATACRCGAVCVCASRPGSSEAAPRPTIRSTARVWCVTLRLRPESSAVLRGSPTSATSCGATAAARWTSPCTSCSCCGWRSSICITVWISCWRSFTWETFTPKRRRGCSTDPPATSQRCRTHRWDRKQPAGRLLY